MKRSLGSGGGRRLDRSPASRRRRASTRSSGPVEFTITSAICPSCPPARGPSRARAAGVRHADDRGRDEGHDRRELHAGDSAGRQTGQNRVPVRLPQLVPHPEQRRRAGDVRRHDVRPVRARRTGPATLRNGFVAIYTTDLGRQRDLPAALRLGQSDRLRGGRRALRPALIGALPVRSPRAGHVRRATALRLRGMLDARPRSSATGTAAARRGEAAAIAGSSSMIRCAVTSSGASKIAMPVLTRPSVGPTRIIVPSASSRWSRSKWTPHTRAPRRSSWPRSSRAGDG